MNGWIKKFTDGKTEIGWDSDVLAGRASWSKGRLQGMDEAYLRHEGREILIASKGMPGHFHQEDDYEADMSGGKPVLVARRLRRLLTTHDTILVTDTYYKHQKCSLYNDYPPLWLSSPDIMIRRIDSSHGKWLTVELDTQTWKMSLRIHD